MNTVGCVTGKSEPRRDEIPRQRQPQRKGPASADNELISEKAKLAYPIRDGIPIMLVSEARRLDE